MMKTQTMNQELFDRVRRLERANRNHWRLLSLLGMGTLGLFLASYGSQGRELEAESFVLRDPKGNVRAVLRCSQYGPSLVFASDQGETLTELSSGLLRFSEKQHGWSSSLSYNSLEFHDEGNAIDSSLSSSRISFVGDGFRAEGSPPPTEDEKIQRQIGDIEKEHKRVSLGIRRKMVRGSLFDKIAIGENEQRGAIVDEPFLSFDSCASEREDQAMLRIGVDASLQENALSRGDLDVTENEILHNPAITVSSALHCEGVTIEPGSLGIWRLPNALRGSVSASRSPIACDGIRAIDLGFADSAFSPRISLHDDSGEVRAVIGTVALTKKDGGTETTSPGSVVLFDREGSVVEKLPRY